MKEQRPILLHFFEKKHVTGFGAVCRSYNLRYDIREVHERNPSKTEYYVTTEPVTSTIRSKVIADWAKASMEVL